MFFGNIVFEKTAHTMAQKGDEVHDGKVQDKTYGFNGDYICLQRAVFRMRYCF